MKSKKVTAMLLAGAALMGLAVSGCGNTISDTAEFAKLGDTVITMGVANFFAKYQQAVYDSYYMAYFGEDMWNSDLYGNGKTLSEDMKENVVESLQDMYTLKAHMADYDISLSEEEEAAITKAAEEFIAANSKEAIRQIGAENPENVKEMLRLQTIQKKMHDRMIQDADTTVTDEEAAQRTFSYVTVAADHTHEEEGEEGEHPEEELAALKATADSIASAEDFDKAVTDAGLTVSTASYGSAADEGSSFDTSVLEAADALKAGQVSQTIEVDGTYYVLRLDSEHDEQATENKRQELISQKQEDHYNDILDGWKEAEDAAFQLNEEEWAKVVFEDRFKAPEPETESVSGTEEGTADTIDNAGTESAADTTDGAGAQDAADAAGTDAGTQGTESAAGTDAGGQGTENAADAGAQGAVDGAGNDAGAQDASGADANEDAPQAE